MELTRLIKERKSVRRFSDRRVSLGLVRQAVALAKLAPSAGAIRGYEMTVTEALDYYGAPVHVVISMDVLAYEQRYGSRGVSLYAVQDSAIAGAFLILALQDLGMSACWIGAFNESRVMDVTGLTKRPVAVIAVGYKGE